ncbi:MAG: septum formation inhibitor Maf [Clostridia bacterium]|nr:septum formation inhibitor Maf [Clostridia bacterium]
MKKLILASGSPRRKEILNNMGLNFEVMVSSADEGSVDSAKLPVGVYVQELALLKASAVAKSVACRDALIISADTVVACDGKILGKPKDAEDAFSMLKSLSGKCHSVFTGICVMRTKDAYSVCAAEETKVYFKELSDERIQHYVETKEPMDKAGAYGIQGKGCLLVKGIDGDYLNVVGLPAARLAEILEKDFNFDVFKGECK